MICDAQVHIWAANTPERPWPARHPPHREPLGKEELLGEMDKAGADRVVIVPPSWEGDRNDLAIDAAQSHPGPLRSRRAWRARGDHRLEEAAEHARHALHLPYRDPAPAADRRPLRLRVGRVAAKVSVHPHIRRLFDVFGPKRTFWGTDWSRLPCSYRQGVTMFTEDMPWLKGQELDWVTGRRICEWIGWRM